MLEKLKALLGIQDDKQDVILQFTLDNATDIILNYCHIKEIPKGLETTAIRMAMDIWRSENVGSGELASHITSIKEGDTATQFQLIGLSEVYTQSLMKDYQAQLNRFRKVRW